MQSMTQAAAPGGGGDDAQSRLAFLQIDAATRSDLREAWAVAKPALGDVLDGFYAHLLTQPQLAGRVKGNEPRLKSAQGVHWERLFSGAFDDAYFESVRRIGMAHVKIGLEPRWYIGGYAFVQDRLLELFGREKRFSGPAAMRLARAASKAVMLDMELAISVYQDKIMGDLEAKNTAIETAINAFDHQVAQALGGVAAASDRLTGTASTLEAAALATNDRSSVVASAASDTAAIVRGSAAATEELAASIRQIGEQSRRSMEKAEQAAQEATRTNGAMTQLADTANRIGSVVGLISAIAGQTNLLALNATIEAARAGDAGRGFAVVASEVKELARQTAEATDSIASQIAAIQASTQTSAGDIARVLDSIAEVADIAGGISLAVEQQAAATREIAENAQGAARNTGEVNDSIVVVQESNNQTHAAAIEVHTLAGDIRGQVKGIQTTVRAFFEKVRAA
ncbi:protoglobin domain-containing protein [Methylopila musalis]